MSEQCLVTVYFAMDEMQAVSLVELECALFTFPYCSRFYLSQRPHLVSKENLDKISERLLLRMQSK